MRKFLAKIFYKLGSMFDPKYGIDDISNEYTRYLTYVNPGFLHAGNLKCFQMAIQDLPGDHPIVEIGVFCGLSTNIIHYYMQKADKQNRMFNVDIWKLYEYDETSNIGDSNRSHKAYSSYLKEVYKMNIDMFYGDPKPFTVEATSDDFFMDWKNKQLSTSIFGEESNLGGSISFCFIDGDHRYEQAKKDFENCDAFLAPGGYILFDDSSKQAINPGNNEVYRIVNEALGTGRYEVALENPNFLLKKAH